LLSLALRASKTDKQVIGASETQRQRSCRHHHHVAKTRAPTQNRPALTTRETKQHTKSGEVLVVAMAMATKNRNHVGMNSTTISAQTQLPKENA
jgi:hypothetical protein